MTTRSTFSFICVLILIIKSYFEAGEYWMISTTDATPEFTLHVQQFLWVKHGFLEEMEITSGSCYRLGVVVSNRKEDCLSIYGWEQLIQSRDQMVLN